MLYRPVPLPSKFTQSSISWLVVVVGRRWVVIWNPLIELYRLVVVWMNNIDLLPINSTKSTLTIRIWSPKATFQIQISNTMTIIRQPFESSFQAQSNQCINTARPPCGRPRKTHLTTISAIMMIVTSKISKSARINQRCHDSWHIIIHPDQERCAEDSCKRSCDQWAYSRVDKKRFAEDT